MKVLNFRPLANKPKPGLVGIFDLELQDGLILRRCELREKNGRHVFMGPWKMIGGYLEPFLGFSSPDVAEQFAARVVVALDLAAAKNAADDNAEKASANRAPRLSDRRPA